MPSPTDHPLQDALSTALDRLNAAVPLPRAIALLRSRSQAVTSAVQACVIEEIPAFSESHNESILPELARHAAEHTKALIRLLDAGDSVGFAFVHDHVRRRARQRFPMQATLHAYRCSHRLYSRWIRDAVVEVADPESDHHALMMVVADFTLTPTPTPSVRSPPMPTAIRPASWPQSKEINDRRCSTSY